MPAAPQTLLPRLLEAIRRESVVPWYRRPWPVWPSRWQVASLVLMGGLLVGGVLALGPVLDTAVGQAAMRAMSQMASFVTNPIRCAEVVTRAGGILWRAVFGPAFAYLFPLFLVTTASCALIGTALTRLALGRMIES